MKAADLESLKVLIELADLLERCQTSLLITPDERVKYREQLNDKIHKEIESLLPEV